MGHLDNAEIVRKKFEPLLKGLSYYELNILNTLVVNHMRLIRQAGTLLHMSKLNVGDRVSWYGSDAIKRTGIVIKLNHKTVSVKIGNEGYWNVSPELLNKE
jgi:hypothetical protein